MPGAARPHLVRRARQILSARGDADEPAERVQRVSVVGDRALSLLSSVNFDVNARSGRRKRWPIGLRDIHHSDNLAAPILMSSRSAGICPPPTTGEPTCTK